MTGIAVGPGGTEGGDIVYVVFHQIQRRQTGTNTEDQQVITVDFEDLLHILLLPLIVWLLYQLFTQNQ